MSNSELIKEAKRKIASVRGKSLTVEERSQAAVELASLMLREANNIQTKDEKEQFAQLARMMRDPKGKAFAINMTDQCFRSSQPARIVNQLNYILKQMGIPSYVGFQKKAALKLFRLVGKWMPSLFVPLIRGMLRRETANLILPGEPSQLARHMKRRHQEGVRINLNHLGEAILGEEEAQRRLKIYLDDLAKPEVEYISIKISTIYSQINLLAWEKTVLILAERLRELLRVADKHTFKRKDGTAISKFVNLDMEEYKDLRLTVDVFKKVLDEPEFKNQSAGIVLQSYLPDSFAIQQELTQWAMQRVARGDAPIKIRIVKGANLAMEEVEASLRGWPQAPYPQKADVDANFKRMVEYGMQKEHAAAVLLGIGSHNVLDVAYAYLLCVENEVEHAVCFEMLEGMADHIRRVVQQLTGDMLLYCPAATREEFQHALAYLVRRLDENTAQENFLRHIFEMAPGTPEWEEQVALFSAAALQADKVSAAPRRTQNRCVPPLQPELCASFDNEPDTDWSLAANQAWAQGILAEWATKQINPIPIVISGEEILQTTHRAQGIDPSRPGEVVYDYCLADAAHVEQSLASIKKAEAAWQQTSESERALMLADISHALRIHRRDLIGAMVLGTGKTIPEADVELSEAVDFAEYYRRNIEELQGLQDIAWKPKGTVLVAPPWNFPCSIPAGGILAALAAGNCVIFKPAPEAVLVGWYLVQALWEAGVSKDVLHFIPCQDEPAGSLLVTDARVNAIILTGATETARLFMKMRPKVDLMAETGGKNSIIVSAASDRDLAIRDIVQSAFGHAGQKCSACSLAILEAEVYDDPHFLNQLRDAAASLTVGSAWDAATKVNPLIRAPGHALQRGLTHLEDGERWLLQPKMVGNNPQLWSPGIKLGVKPGSFMHQTELFGPVLGVMRGDNLQHCIEIANGTPYGLTSGLQSLDEREKIIWLDQIEAGNCYINRGITGAVVRRQPFGGCKESSFGPAAKAGGPNYLMQLMSAEQRALPMERDKLDEAASRLLTLAEGCLSAEEFQIWNSSVSSYTFFWKNYFCKDHDPSNLWGQDNQFRYRAHNHLCVRLQAEDSLLDLWRLAAIIASLGMSLEVSLDPTIKAPLVDLDAILPQVIWTVEGEEEWLKKTLRKEFDQVRLLSNPSGDTIKALAESGVHFQVSPILANGRVELLKFLREISISSDYHRYGNLGLREGEKRRPLPQPSIEPMPPACGTTCCCD